MMPPVSIISSILRHDIQQTYPGETVEFRLVAGRELPMNRSQCRLLLRELFVEVAGISHTVLSEEISVVYLIQT